jgi:hypothetical protein
MAAEHVEERSWEPRAELTAAQGDRRQLFLP